MGCQPKERSGPQLRIAPQMPRPINEKPTRELELPCGEQLTG